MANQMIALQARNPQLPDPARATTQMANMINMARQTEAAQRQAQQAEQAMRFAAAEEGRKIETQEEAITKARADNIRAVVADLTEQYKLVESDAGHNLWLQRLEKADPATAEQVRALVPTYNPDKIFNIMLKAKELADKLVPDVVASKEYAAGGGVDAQGRPVPDRKSVV
jgi:hypothetical protein